MTIDTTEYKKIIDEIKRKSWQEGYEEGVQNKQNASYNQGYDDGVKDVFMTIRRNFANSVDDIFKHEEKTSQDYLDDTK